MPNFLAVDFYCGAGGTTRGLLDAGGYVIAGIDKDETCRLTYERNNRNTALDRIEPAFLPFDMFRVTEDYPEGQQDAVWDALNTLIPYYREMSPETPLLFSICAPCQSFTKFVQRSMTQARTESRARDHNLLAQTIRFVDRFEPDMVLSENVGNLSDGRYRKRWENFWAALIDRGYQLGARTICASRFGIPQYRRRSILLGIKRGQGGEMSFDLPIPDRDPILTSPISTRSALEHLPELQAGQVNSEIPNHACRNLSEINRLRLLSLEPGQPNFGFDSTPFGDLSLPCHRRLAKKGKPGFGDVYTRMHPERPSPTITTRFHSISNGRFGHYDPEQVRGLSLREGAILQSFGDGYKFYGQGMDSVAKMIGNAVPPKLSEFMANWLYGLWADGKQEGQDE